MAVLRRFLIPYVIASAGVLARAQAPLSYVAITPCRVVDTRNPTGPLGGPTMQYGVARTFPIAQGACNIPSSAAAYSFNLAVVPQGPLYYVTIWPTGEPEPTTANLNDYTGLVLSNAVIVAAGTNGAVDLYTLGVADVVLDINGYFIPQSVSTSTALGTGASNAGPQNTALGFNALQVNAGSSNTGVGSYTLAANSIGSNNTALGASALFSNALGSANTAIGTQAMLNNLVGNDNTSIGFSALETNTVGSSNVSVGATSLGDDVNGSYNTAIGTAALSQLTSGSWNIAIGYQAGNLIDTGTNNIDIGHTGNSTESGVIRIGTASSQTSAYIAGISSSMVSGVPVLVNGSGQLGISISSERFKKDVKNVGNTSDGLMKLRPVIFRYRDADVGSIHYGLLAEEVEKVYPEFVVYDSDGRPYSLAYQELPTLLLNELQKQHRLLQRQRSQLASQQQTIRNLEQRFSVLEQAHGKGVH
jgi:hypothetical protein